MKKQMENICTSVSPGPSDHLGRLRLIEIRNGGGYRPYILQFEQAESGQPIFTQVPFFTNRRLPRGAQGRHETFLTSLTLYCSNTLDRGAQLACLANIWPPKT